MTKVSQSGKIRKISFCTFITQFSKGDERVSALHGRVFVKFQRQGKDVSNMGVITSQEDPVTGLKVGLSTREMNARASKHKVANGDGASLSVEPLLNNRNSSGSSPRSYAMATTQDHRVIRTAIRST